MLPPQHVQRQPQQPTARRLQMSSPPLGPRLPVQQRPMMQLVSPDLVTRAWRGMLTTPERDARAVGISIPWGHGLVRAVHPGPVAVPRPFSADAQPLIYAQPEQLQQLYMQQAQFQQAQQLQNMQILQCLQHLVLQISGSGAAGGSELLRALATAQQLPATQPLAWSMPPALQQEPVQVAMESVGQPSSSARQPKRRDLPQLKHVRDMQSFWQLWHHGDELSGISAVKMLTGTDKHRQRQRISEWSKAVEAIEAKASSSNPSSSASLAAVNDLELKRRQSSESVRALVMRLGKELAEERKLEKGKEQAVVRAAEEEPGSSS